MTWLIEMVHVPETTISSWTLYGSIRAPENRGNDVNTMTAIDVEAVGSIQDCRGFLINHSASLQQIWCQVEFYRWNNGVWSQIFLLMSDQLKTTSKAVG
jgi:hypothetical protein